jgi:nucleoside diphosphate kinase
MTFNAGIEKLAAVKKNRELIHHTNIRNAYNGIIGYGYALS